MLTLDNDGSNIIDCNNVLPSLVCVLLNLSKNALGCVLDDDVLLLSLLD